MTAPSPRTSRLDAPGRETAWEELLRLRAEADAAAAVRRRRNAALLAAWRRRQADADAVRALADEILAQLPVEPAAACARRRLVLGGWDGPAVQQIAAEVLAGLPTDPNAAGHRKALVEGYRGH